MSQHSEECEKARLTSEADRSVYMDQWPNHCTVCHGWGYLSELEYETGRGCRFRMKTCGCVQSGICPRCGLKQSRVCGVGHCDDCGWWYNDPGLRPAYCCIYYCTEG